MEQFLHNNALFVVLGIVLILWFGIALYIFFIDNKLSKLEKHFSMINSETSSE